MRKVSFRSTNQSYWPHELGSMRKVSPRSTKQLHWPHELVRMRKGCFGSAKKLYWTYRLRAKKGPAPPLGNFADIFYLEENFKPHLLKHVCTLCSGALVSDSL